jgi:hypothetical protein
MRKAAKKAIEGWAAVIVVVAIIMATLIGTLGMIGYMMGPKYDYNTAVGSHIENAKAAASPELMIEELDLAVEGMRALGLEDEMYSRWYSWKQIPSRQMAYQYALIESIVERCHEVIDWRSIQDQASGQVTDVYSQKMSALRDEISGCDGIALNAFKVNIYPYYGVYVFIIIAGLLWTALIMMTVWLVVESSEVQKRESPYLASYYPDSSFVGALLCVGLCIPLAVATLMLILM